MSKLNDFYLKNIGVMVTIFVVIIIMLETCNLSRKNTTRVSINRKSIETVSIQLDSLGKIQSDKNSKILVSKTDSIQESYERKLEKIEQKINTLEQKIIQTNKK